MMLGARLAIIIAAIVTYAAPALGSGHGHGHHKKRTGTLLNRMRRITGDEKTAATRAQERHVQAALKQAMSAGQNKPITSPALRK